MTEHSDDFINHLLAQMTLDEKIGQLNQPIGGDSLTPEAIRLGKVGSMFSGSGPQTGFTVPDSPGAEHSNYLQQLAAQSRLKIPLIIGRDVIHGHRTIFPIPLAQAATFNPGLAEQAAAVAALEATADGVKWTFAPMLDIARDPRWGRVAEGNGEDPYLGSRMASSVVKGYQGEDMSQPDKLVACAKHFAGYGSAEGGRDYDGGEISEPTLRDVYLPPFASAVRAGVGTVMSAFLDLNGTPATANRRMLTGMLREEWGFDGFVVSDWDSVGELILHGVAENRAEAASLALHAGVDMDMVSEAYSENLAADLQQGRVSIEELNQAVSRILRIKQRAGLFDDPFTDVSRYPREVLTTGSRQLARKQARECMVLLKNKNDLLPLESCRKVVVAGNFVHARAELLGSWASEGRAEDVTPLGQALQEAAPKGTSLLLAEDADQAQDLALQGDAVVLVLGEHPRRSGENSNLSDLTLPPEQAAMVDRMASLGKPLVLVVFAGRPLVLTRQLPQVDALLYAWHPGIEGGAALGEILFGMHAPSGRLPITFPRATGQVPIYYNHKNSGRPISEDGWFRSRYVDLLNPPLFPFGFGLSYTHFDYSALELSSETLRGRITVSASLTNSGHRLGSELVQLYVRDLVGSLTRPVRELKGFQHVELSPGETRRVSFDLDEELLAFTRADGTHGVEPGRYQVWIAPDSASGLMGDFSL